MEILSQEQLQSSVSIFNSGISTFGSYNNTSSLIYNDSPVTNTKNLRGRPKKVVQSTGRIIHKQSHKSTYISLDKKLKLEMIYKFQSLKSSENISLKTLLEQMASEYNISYAQAYESLINFY